MPSRFSIYFTCTVLSLGLGFVLYGATRKAAPSFHGDLHKLLPEAPHGWTMIEKPIADSQEMKKAVGEILNFDDAVLVDYTNAQNERFSVYIAYWKPGKMSYRLVAGHTPDVCWPGAGWQKTFESRLQRFSLTDETGKSVIVPDGESRTFTIKDQHEHVWFWHIVGQESKSYGSYSPPWYSAISDILRKGMNQRDEQFFVRLSSHTPLAQENIEPVIQSLLRKIPWPTSPTPNSAQ